MGNILSFEQRETNLKILSEIRYLQFSILDIGDRCGDTTYIDFIKSNEVSNDVMKGIDIFRRPFFVFKATIKYENGNSIKSFTTWFQRYTDNDLLWHTCGNDGFVLFDTSGGANIEQMIFIKKLFKNGEVMGDDIIRLTNQVIESDLIDPEKDRYKITPKPVSVKLGWN